MLKDTRQMDCSIHTTNSLFASFALLSIIFVLYLFSVSILPREQGHENVTLFGSLKEFSSVNLLDVSIVFVDPDALIPYANPLMEIATFMVSPPKLTICIKQTICS